MLEKPQPEQTNTDDSIITISPLEHFGSSSDLHMPAHTQEVCCVAKLCEVRVAGHSCSTIFGS